MPSADRDARPAPDPAVRVVVATAADGELLAPLAGIEAAADAAFEPFFGPRPFGEDTPPSGFERAGQDGFVLVDVMPGGASGATVLGFVHVLTVDGEAHLEQLAVLPEHHGRGTGRALLEAAAGHAADKGYPRLTLRTFAEVPFNAPWYARRGFAVIAADTAFLRGLIRTEDELGLTALGPRVTMARPLHPPRS